MMNLVSRLDLEGVVASVVESVTAVTSAALAAWFALSYFPDAREGLESLLRVIERYASN